MQTEITAALKAEEVAVTDDAVRAVMALPNPPLKTIGRDDIYIRRCLLSGDAVNCYWGRFRTGDLPLLAQKAAGAPLLTGHNTGKLPVGRFITGRIVERECVSLISGKPEPARFIEQFFYWMKDATGAEDLRTNIDGGIYTQASISWTYTTPECSICGEDIRSCAHIPGETYKGETCWYWYAGITDVLEGSIVYRGGHPGTGFSLAGGMPIDGRELCGGLLGKPLRKVIRNGRTAVVPVFFGARSTETAVR